MSAYRVVPPPAELRKLLALGLTHQQIADRVYEETGQWVTRNAVTMACGRAGLTSKERYDDVIPWKVSLRHEGHYALAMLRLLGRRRRGKPLTVEATQRLDSWLGKRRARGEVVAYEPSSPDGFYYVPRLGTDRDVIREPS